jgi:hypothetical protein
MRHLIAGSGQSRRLIGSVMNRSIFVAASGVVFWVMLALPAPAQAPVLPANPQIQVDYIQPKNNSTGEFAAIYAWLRARRPLEEIQKFLAPLRLPRQIKIQVDACGAESRAYVSGNPVTICYELIDKIQKMAASIPDPALKQTVVVGTFTQTVLHELAYAVFDVLQVPVWGREDDAADRLAAFVLLQFSGDVAHTAMVGSAEFFLLSRKPGRAAHSPIRRRRKRSVSTIFSVSPTAATTWILAAGPRPLRVRILCCPISAPNNADMNTSKFAIPSICELCPT